MLRVDHEITNWDYGPYWTGNLFAGGAPDLGCHELNRRPPH
jgi:hypothetical protein